MEISVKELIKKAREVGIDLEILCGEKTLTNKIKNPRIQKPGLALTGFTYHIHSDRLQIFGDTEITYLKQLSTYKRRKAVKFLEEVPISCLVITKGLAVPEIIKRKACKVKIPLLRTTLQSSIFIQKIEELLADLLSEKVVIHGNLIDVFGVGILIIGKSGIGKSELSLALVMRNHRFIADDMVEITKKTPGVLIGRASELLKYIVEIRGLGIVNIKDLFGISAIRDTKRIELVIELVEWKDDTDYDRLGFEENFYDIMGIKVPLIRLPVTPGRQLPALIEVAARNYLLKLKGIDSAKEFKENLDNAMKAQLLKEEIE